MHTTRNIGLFEIFVALGVLLLWAGSWIWAARRKGKYLDPYVLKQATPKDKRRWAVVLTAIQFGPLGILFAMVIPFLSVSPINFFVQAMRWSVCAGGLAFALVMLGLWEYWKIESKLSSYLRWNGEKKKDSLTKLWLFSNTGLLNSEVKERFWEFGYLDDNPTQVNSR